MNTHTLTSVRVRERLHRGEDGPSHEQKQGRGAAGRVEGHVSVFADEVLAYLNPQKGQTIVDATAGEGGHSFRILSERAGTRLIAIDADPESVAKTTARLEKFAERAEVVEANFSTLESVLKKLHVPSIDGALFDLGWNSGQLVSGRGFSFMHDEPLNMSYGKRSASGFTAAEILNEWKEETIANVLFGYGDEKYSRRIAKAIVERRKIQPFATTIELVETIADAVPAGYKRGRIHFATKTFQALRIAVNNELGVIEESVAAAWKHLSLGGRIVVITFHSTEDRVVKKLFAGLAKEGGKLVLKKPLTPSAKEVQQNPRARSAKLRVIEKVC